MKKSFLFPLILAGLALGGCNSSTRSSSTTALDSSTSTSPVGIEQSAAYPAASTAANTNANANTTSSPLNESSTAVPVTPDPAPGASLTPPIPSPSAVIPPAVNPPGSPGTGSTYSSTDTPAPGSSAPLTGVSTLPTEPVRVTPDPSPSSTLGATSASTSATGATAAFDSSRTADPVSSLTTGDVGGRITEWHLTATEIESDLARGVTVVRTKDAVVGAPIAAADDAVTQTMVQGKLQADHETSKARFDVEAKNGEIMLKGTADSAAAIGRGIALALDTQGVTKVSSDVKLNSRATP